jgi:hypothetical protein
MSETTKTIQHLNDQFRNRIVTHRQGVFVTSGVAALGWEAVERIIRTVATFDDFCRRNDPYSEHDFGCFDAEGSQIFFKIDYYDRALANLSPNPADPTVTVRIITVMLAEEY